MSINDLGYQKILVATDFSNYSECVIKKAVSIAQQSQAKLDLIHVVEIPVYPVLEDVAVMGIPGLWDEKVAEQLQSASRVKLEKLAQQYSISDFHLIMGMPSSDIVNYAKQLKADLILIGTHGSSGLKRLIGSTANSIINDAECDVLTVRIQDKEC